MDLTPRNPQRDVWEPSEPVGEASLVRPYTLTAGRTASRVDLPLEAPIRTVRSAPAPRWPGRDVRAEILRLGGGGPSVAEIAAHLSLPLGVARVLIGDLVAQGYLRVDATLGASADIEERRELMGRTLRGLRAL